MSFNLYKCLSEVSKSDLNELVQMLLKKEEFSIETERVITFIIENDLQVIQGVSNSSEFVTRVMSEAIRREQYAGYDYIPEELLPEDDEDYESGDGGLAWVQYVDAWNFLNNLQAYITNKPTIQFPTEIGE